MSLPLARRASVIFALLTLVSSSAGCSAVRMALHLSGTRGGETFTTSRGEGPREERLTVLLDDAPPLEPAPEPPPEAPAQDAAEPPPPPPPPVVVVVPEPPPPPAVVVVVPEPPPEPLPLAFLCQREERFQHEILTHWVREFSLIEKVLLGLVLVFDGSVAIATWSSVLNDPGFSDENTLHAAVIGSVVTADALGLLAIILFMPPVDTSSESRQAGSWRQATACAPPEAVERDGRRMPLDERGWLSAADEAHLVRTLAFEGGGVDVIGAGERRTTTPSLPQVCRWAAERGLRAPRCQGAIDPRAPLPEPAEFVRRLE